MLGKINWNPSPRDIRIFGAVLVAGFGVISLIIALNGKPQLAGGLFIGAAIAGGMSAAFPALGRFLYAAWMGIGFCIGFVVSKIILLVIFFVVFTPVALVFRIMRRDALALRKRAVDTYWNPHPRIVDKDDYSHLY